MLGANMFIMFMSSWWILPLSIMKCPSGSPLWPLFWSLFYLIWVLLPWLFFFSCPLAWKVCFQPFTFSLCRSFVLKWVSHRQHMCRSCFLIHSVTLCLMIGTFNPLTFKVIIHRYLFIFPLCTCIPLSHSFPSSSYSSAFSKSCSAGLVEMCSFSLLLSRKLLISPSTLIESLAG